MHDVVVKNLVKTFEKCQVQAVNDVSFTVEAGELFGLIGPDGAGKTTLFRMLTTLLQPDSGQASVCGFNILDDLKSIRSQVGYMPGKFSLYQDLSVKENLSFFATIFGTTVEKNYDTIKDIYIQLEPFKNRRAGQLSGGMKQKLALCCALIHRPRILFLDEPTTGVDTVSRKEFWEMLIRLKGMGITILVSTPYMDEANLCERIALMQAGQILSINTPKEIINQYPRALFAVKAEQMSRLLGTIRTFKFVQSCYAFGEFHHITFHQLLPDNLPRLKEELKGFESLEIKKITPTIEDCFIQLMNEEKQMA